MVVFARRMAAIFEHSPPIKLQPKPGFVVKTKVVEGLGLHSYGKKVFINICHDGQVPKPSGDYDLEEIFAKIVKNEWEIPIVVSLEKTESDKKGVPAFVYDCCINSDTFVWVQLNNDLRLILIEWAIESVETMHDLVLEREYTIPKMLCKGQLSETEITKNDLNGELQQKMGRLRENEVASLVEQLIPDDEESIDDGPLPDIMNIGRTRKPLIKEIEELSIDEKNKPADASDQDQRNDNSRSPIILPVRKEDDLMRELNTIRFKGNFATGNQHKNGKIVEVELEALQAPTPSEVLEYTFSLSLKKVRDQFILVLRSEQLTPLIEVTYRDEANVLRVKNRDACRRLGPSNFLEVPLPQNVTPYKAFVVKQEQSLYVFAKLSD